MGVGGGEGEHNLLKAVCHGLAMDNFGVQQQYL